MASGGNPATIQELYHEAYAFVEQGICYDEIGNREGALAMYENGLQLIDRAGQMPGAEGSSMYHKMVAAREHILYRLKDLRSDLQPSATRIPGNLPVPVAGAQESTNDWEEIPTPPPYQAIEDTLCAFGQTKSADEIFEISGGVQIFLIKGEETSVPSYPGPLRVFRFKPDSPSAPRAAGDLVPASDGDPPAFLQVADWVYPLVPGRSPVLHSSYGAYIFANPTADFPDLYVGVLLPSDLDRATVTGFEDLMKQLTELRQQSEPSGLTTEQNQALSTKISKLLVSGGQMLAWGIEKGAGKTSVIIKEQAEKTRQKERQCETPAPVDPRLRTSVHYLRKGTKVAVKVSGYLVDKLGEAAAALGSHLATKAQKSVEGTGAAGLVSGTIEVVTGGIAGIASVWMGLEKASRTLAKDITNETVMIVHHKYGAEAAAVTDDSMHAAAHGGLAAWNVYSLGPKSIAKRSAKGAGLTFLKDLGGNKDAKAIKAAPAEQPDSKPTRWVFYNRSGCGECTPPSKVCQPHQRRNFPNFNVHLRLFYHHSPTWIL